MRGETRRSVRVKIKEGFVHVFHSAMPALRCRLLDFSEGGIRCISQTQDLDAFAVQVWKQVFGSGKALQVDVSGCIRDAEERFEAEVRHLKVDYDGEIEFGLQFIRLSDGQRAQLQRAVALFEKYGGEMIPAAVFQTVEPPKASESAFYAAVDEIGLEPEPQRSAPKKAPSVVAPAVQAPAAEAAPPSKPTKQFPAAKSSERLQALARSFWGKEKDEEGDKAPGKPPVRLERKASSQSGRFQQVVAWFKGGTSAKAAVPTAQNFRGMKVGEILLRLNARLKPKHLMDAHDKARAAGVKFGRYLLDQKLISPAELCRALSLQSGLPIVDLSSIKIPPAAAEVFSYETLCDHEIVPFNVVDDTLYLAATSPNVRRKLPELEKLGGKPIKLFLAQDDAILGLLGKDEPTDD